MHDLVVIAGGCFASFASAQDHPSSASRVTVCDLLREPRLRVDVSLDMTAAEWLRRWIGAPTTRVQFSPVTQDCGALVRGRPFEPVDHEDLHWAAAGFELQPQPLQ